MRLIGAVLLAANGEWQLQHRYMQTEAMTELTPLIETQPSQISTVAARSLATQSIPRFHHIGGRDPRRALHSLATRRARGLHTACAGHAGGSLDSGSDHPSHQLREWTINRARASKPLAEWGRLKSICSEGKAAMYRAFASSLYLSVGVLLIQPTLDTSRAFAALLSPAAVAHAETLDKLPPVRVPHVRKPPLDHSGRTQVGQASFYAAKHNHRMMADGRRFSSDGNSASSRNLPLGTTAKVVNLESKKSVIVNIEDRGPYPRGRVLDVSSKVAEHLKMKKTGVATVLVKPIVVPQPSGGMQLGAGAAEVSPREVQQAVRTAKELSSKHRHTSG